MVRLRSRALAAHLLLVAGLVLRPGVGYAQEACAEAQAAINLASEHLASAESKLSAGAGSRTEHSLRLAEIRQRAAHFDEVWAQANVSVVRAHGLATEAEEHDPPTVETLRDALNNLIDSDEALAAAHEETAQLAALAGQVSEAAPTAGLLEDMEEARLAIPSDELVPAECSLIRTQRAGVQGWLTTLEASLSDTSVETEVSLAEQAATTLAEGEAALVALQQETAEMIDSALGRLRS